jgi:DNA-binding transcriptional LysR family regulator
MERHNSNDGKRKERFGILPNSNRTGATAPIPHHRDQQLLDNRLFRAFMAAAETENFTLAAKKTFMTQSGISQHIAKLEKQVGLPLFKRVAKRVTLTSSGVRLKKYIEDHSTKTMSFLDELRESYDGLAGSASFAMPMSCLSLPQFLSLLERRRDYPFINLNVKIALPYDIIRMVLEDKVDFGLVTRKSDHPNLSFSAFCQEEYVLSAACADMLIDVEATKIDKLAWIAYPGVDAYFERWRRYHFPRRKDLEFLSLPIPGSIDAIEGAKEMVRLGMGISIFPRHCIESLLADNRLSEFKTQKAPLLNNIYIVSLKKHVYPKVVRQIMAWLTETER